MTIAIGNEVSYGSGAFYDARIGSDAVEYLSDTVARVSFHIYSYHSGALYDSVNNASTYGSLHTEAYGARAYSSSAADTMSYNSLTKDFTRTYAGFDVSQTFWVEGLADSSGGGARSTVVATIPIAARPVRAPSTPGAVSISNRTTSSFRASWSPSADWNGDVGWYRVRLSDDNFATYTDFTVAAGTTYKDFGGLPPGDAFQVRVYAVNSAGTSGYVSKSTSTLVAKPNGPASASISAVTSDGFRVSWPTPTDWGGETGSYVVRLSNNNFASYGDYAVPYGTNLKDFARLSPGSAYQTHVWAINSAGWGGYASAYATTLAAVPSAGKTPSLSSLTDTSVVASWADPDNWNGDNSSDFDLQIDNATNFWGATQYSVLNANSKTLAGLIGNTTRYLRDRAKNSAGAGGFSAARTLLTKPSKCTNIYASHITPTSATPLASAPAGGASSYLLQVATDAGFTNTVYWRYGSSLSRPLSGLTPATRYYMRWLSTNSSGTMGWTSTVYFDTLPGAYVRDGATLKQSTVYVWDGATLKTAQPYVRRTGAWRL